MHPWPAAPFGPGPQTGTKSSRLGEGRGRPNAGGGGGALSGALCSAFLASAPSPVRGRCTKAASRVPRLGLGDPPRGTAGTPGRCGAPGCGGGVRCRRFPCLRLLPVYASAPRPPLRLTVSPHSPLSAPLCSRHPALPSASPSPMVFKSPPGWGALLPRASRDTLCPSPAEGPRWGRGGRGRVSFV